jgi:hypothetical protein
MSGNRKITIDGAVLRRSGSDLTRIADGLGEASARISGAPMSSTAFGAMNSWMVDPITSVSTRSTRLISASGEVTESVAKAAKESAGDFEALEQAIVTSVSGFLAQLDTP